MYETKPYFYGTGRRKHSVARVRVYNGTGKMTINGRDINDYFGLETLKLLANSPLVLTENEGKFVYGYAYAADTGTAMMAGSAFIDLYYETYDESVMSAVIPVNVYVLDDETAAKYKEQNDAILAADTVVGR